MNPADCQPDLEQEYQLNTWHTLLPKLFPRVELFSQPHDFPLTNEQERNIATSRRQFGSAALADGKRIAFYEVDVRAKVDLLRNRVALRNLVADCIDEASAHAVLAFFVHPDKSFYRLTYASKESRLGDDLKIYTEETSTRRFTYILGPGEKRRTAAIRLAGLSEKRDTIALKDVTDAFSVDKLNNEFFDTYKAHYQKFCTHLLESDVPAQLFGLKLKGLDGHIRDKALKPVRDFVKKLLGRLVFLHFLQKKGWLGCPAGEIDWKNGESDFLAKLFRECSAREQERFHSRRLVPLFFETLNRERKGDLFEATGTRVPYLNGGLFERDFESVEKIEFPPGFFAGVLEFFSHYNFTIDENDPDDHEIGIDPEMLGHIFENLLEDNKDKGAYYTPKAVVQYMCQQTLIQALIGHFPGDEAARAGIETLIRLKEPIDVKKESWLASHAWVLEKILDDLHICDPAIGSGAFPIGLLQEIFWTKLTLHPALNRGLIKRAIIQRSIYGVDLDAGAVEIARLRFWLALIVNEDAPLPLPNLDYQIMQGNSLLESFEGLDLSKISHPVRVGITLLGSNQGEMGFSATQLEIEDSSPVRENLASLQEKYFQLHDPEAKAQLRRRIDHAVLCAIDDELVRRREHLDASLDNWKRELRRKRELKKHYEPIPKELKARDRMQAEIADLLVKKRKLHSLLENPRAERPFFLWHLWFRHVLNVPPMGRNGFDIVIANPPYISAIDYKNAFGDAARDELKSHYETATGAWDVYILFYELALKLLAMNGVACLINPNKYLAAPYAEGLRKHLLANSSIIELVDVSRINTFRQVSVYPVITLFQRGAQRQKDIRIFSPIRQCEQDFDIRNFQRRQVAPRYLRLLPEYLWSFLLSVHYKLLDEVLERSRPLCELGEVNASSTASEADAYGRFFIDNAHSKWRLINTGTIDRFQSLWGHATLTHQGEEFLNPCLPESSQVSSTRRDLYNSPKIIFAKMAAVCEAFPDLEGQYASVNTNCFYAPRHSQVLQFFAAVFNSKVFTFIYNMYFGALRMAGGYFQWGSPQLRLIPIPLANELQVRLITNLVDWLLWLRTQPTVLETNGLNPRDPLIADYLDHWLNSLILELYFPERLHASGLWMFELTSKYCVPPLHECKVKDRLLLIRERFEILYDIKHQLRAALYDIGSLELVRIIEDKE